MHPESIILISYFPPAKNSRTQFYSYESRGGGPGLICRALGLAAEKLLAIPPAPSLLPTEQSCALLTRPGAEGLGGGTRALWCRRSPSAIPNCRSPAQLSLLLGMEKGNSP